MSLQQPNDNVTVDPSIELELDLSVQVEMDLDLEGTLIVLLFAGVGHVGGL